LTSLTPAVVTASGNVLAGQSYGLATISWVVGALNGQFNARVIGRSLGNTTVSTPVPNGPYGMALTPTGRLLVTQFSSNTVASGQLPGTAITPAVITVGANPPHVIVDPQGTMAYVTNQISGTVSVVNLALNQAVTTVTLGGEAYNLLMTRDGSEVFVTTNIGLTYRMDPAGTKIDSFTVGPVSNGLVEHPTLPLMYISARDGPTVTVFNRQLNSAVDTFVTGGMPQRIAISPDGGELYIANETLGLDIWNTVTGQRITTIGMPAYGLALSPDGTQLCVTSAGATVRLVDVASRVPRTITTGGGNTRNAIYDATGQTVIVTDLAGVVHFIR
jgi:YVTN family beta-propeller protein